MTADYLQEALATSLIYRYRNEVKVTVSESDRVGFTPMSAPKYRLFTTSHYKRGRECCKNIGQGKISSDWRRIQDVHRILEEGSFQ